MCIRDIGILVIKVENASICRHKLKIRSNIYIVQKNQTTNKK